jgi:DNA-binding MarR family transcriptional regulator
MTDRAALVQGLLEQYERLNVRMAEFGGSTFLGVDITMPQAKVLYLVRAPGSLPMSDLVAKLGVTVPTVTGIVDHLVERGLVVRRVTPADRRRVVIEITPAGVDLIDGIRELNARQLRALLAVLDDEEIGTFHAFFRALDSGLARLVAAAAAAGASSGVEDPAAHHSGSSKTVTPP